MIKEGIKGKKIIIKGTVSVILSDMQKQQCPIPNGSLDNFI